MSEHLPSCRSDGLDWYCSEECPTWKELGTPTTEVIVDYTNHAGNRRERRIAPPFKLSFGSNEWHPEQQWLLRAWDVEKKAFRSFAMKNIHSWRPAWREPR